MQYKDINADGILDSNAKEYAEQLTTQLKKGSLNYLVLLVCDEPIYTSEILTKMHLAELEVMEGTIYPLLTRMQKDGLLQHEWKESQSGPPRKYYFITPYGREVRKFLSDSVKSLNRTINNLERNKK